MSDLAAQAGLLLRNIGLTEQLRARLAELQASRLRIVTAAGRPAAADRARHPRRRPAATARHRRQAGGGRVDGRPGRGRERALVAQLKAETSGALETLRELARGIYPPLLADQGLAAAVSAQARQGARAGRGQHRRRRPLPGRTSRPPSTSAALRHSRTPPGTRRGRRSRISLADSGGRGRVHGRRRRPRLRPGRRGGRIGTAEHERPAGRARRLLRCRLLPRPRDHRRRPDRGPRCGRRRRTAETADEVPLTGRMG